MPDELDRIRRVALNYSDWSNSLDHQDVLYLLQRLEAAEFLVSELTVNDWENNNQSKARTEWERSKLSVAEDYGKCEHGIIDGDWCESCSQAYKQARIDNGME